MGPRTGVAHSKEVKSAAGGRGGGRLRSCSDGSRYSRRDDSSSSPMLSNPKSGETQILEETGEHRGAAATRRTLHQEDVYSTSTAEPPLTDNTVKRSLITSQEQKGGESSPRGTLKFNVIQQVTATSFIQKQRRWKTHSGALVERKYLNHTENTPLSQSVSSANRYLRYER
ncbi:uncharacterized protein LOC115578491 isoform X1 [Sparus aurata]|uniref:uncharacterized protein LOC115578491 isoform X1 n=1 Tax=Sparus aurata TaxID=8175 RepID=UPI0011C12C61|nr:uncharacterized protein LOC115578491 isoform X1 [Sparus aurata]